MRMRSFPAVTLTLAIARSVVIASPAVLHDHRHAHAVKRALVVTKIVDVPGPTVIAYELNGKLVDRQKVCKGIEEGTLLWADGNNVDHGCSSSSTAAVAQPTPTTSITEPLHSAPAVAIEHKEAVTASKVALSHTSEPARSAVAFDSTSISSSATSSSSASTALLKSSPSSATSSSTSASTFALSAAAPYNSEAASTTSSSTPGGKGLDSEFPDGIIDCSTFPSDYGPIEVEWANLGGWSGIQYITVEGDSVTDIVTAVPGGKGCIPGAMCSYACPPGYQKSQWPSTQGATGQSVGGIHCNSNGKLALTNPSLSKYLCIEGTGATTVQNKLSTNVAICRTDYPGTENEVVPLNTEPHSTSPLTCPDASSYFEWNGSPTSAQYYINNQGVALQDACIWNTDGSHMGNWAPSYLGVGRDVFGKTWLSIATTIQNNPSSYTPLNLTVTITGDISGNCRVSNGSYCSGDNYENCNQEGCTVELMSGSATYVLTDGTS